MSNKVFKNHQINVGIPFQVKVPIDGMLNGAQGGTARGGAAYGGAAVFPDFGGKNAANGATNNALRDAADGLADDELGFAADDEIFGSLYDAVYGAADGVANGATDGVADGATDGAADGEMDGAVDGVADGVTDGADEGVSDSADENVDESTAGGMAGNAPVAHNDARRRINIEKKARERAGAMLLEARAESAEIITHAESEAGRIITAAKAEAEKHRTKVGEDAAAQAADLRDKAYGEGEREGREDGRAEYEALISEARQIRDNAMAEYRKMMAGAEADALELILKIAKKVVGNEITGNRDSLISMIKDAFTHCSNKEEVVLKVSPDDFDYIHKNRDRLMSMIEGVDDLEIKRDLSLGSGACYIETPFGNLDAGASTRLAKIEDAFFRILVANRPADNDLIA